MRKLLFTIPVILFAFLCKGQDIELNDIEFRKCNHKRELGGTQQAQYLQYSGMNKYDQKFLRLDVNAEPGSVYISGNVFMTCEAVASLDTFIIELRNNMTVDSFFLNGNRISVTRSADHIFVRLASPLPAGSAFNVQIFYKGNASSYGIYTGTTSGLVYTASLSASYQAREWYPAKQILTDKLDSLEVWVTTSIGNRAGSIGLLQDSTDMPGGKRRFRWKSKYPINYYLPSIAVGNYMDYRNYAKPAAMAPDSILVQHYIANSTSYLNSVKANLDKTPRFIEKFSDNFGLYPFKDEKYGHCLANIGGGMEHQTMSTMANFGTTLIAHELGHQWWGDNVTCASWSDIWLNEGFATYCECLAIEQLPTLFTTTASSYMQSIHSNVMSSPAGSVYIPEASVYDENRLYNGRLSYNKGAAIIHTLRFEMGNTAFFQALKNFQNQYGNSTATAGDFKAVAEAACGKNLTDFFNQWYYGEGYPTISVNYSKSGTDTLLLTISETVSAPTITPFFKGLLELRVTSTAGDTVITVNLSSNNQTFRIPYRKTPNGIVVDPNNWMLNQTGQIGTPPACVSAFEPNETTAAATTLTSGVAITAAIGSSLDIDYYKITTTATNNVSVNMSGPTGADFDLYVYNNAGTQIGAGTSSSASESVSLSNLAAGTYFIKVIGYNGSFSNTCYTLTATATAITSCRSTYDNSTNGSISGAATIPFNTDIKGLIEISNDNDNYKFVITTGGSITLTLTTLPANYNLRLINSAGSILRTSSATGTKNETIAYTAAAGTYYARVYPSGSSVFNATACYTLRVSLGTATRLPESSGGSMIASTTEVFPNPVMSLLNIRLNEGQGTAFIEILDVNGKLLSSHTMNDPQGSFDVSGLARGVYVMRMRRGGITTRTRFVKL